MENLEEEYRPLIDACTFTFGDTRDTWCEGSFLLITRTTSSGGRNHPVQLETDRLILRLPQESDGEALAPIYADPAVMRYIGNGATRTREQVDATVGWMIQQWEENGFGLYVAEQKSDRQVIGRCGLICQTIEEQREIELAYLFGSQSWGRGLATEAAMAIRDHAKGTLHIKRLISLVHPDNVASKRVAKKAGLSYEKTVELSAMAVELFSLK
jgi:ribosomal-protein-alanine N-acetyltransferase